MTNEELSAWILEEFHAQYSSPELIELLKAKMPLRYYEYWFSDHVDILRHMGKSNIEIKQHFIDKKVIENILLILD